MGKRKQQIDAAIRVSKKFFDNQCAVTLTGRPDGAHIFPRDYKTAQGIGLALADVPANIVPLERGIHREFDKHTDPWAKLQWLIENVHDDQRYRLTVWIEVLSEECRQRGIEWSLPVV